MPEVETCIDLQCTAEKTFSAPSVEPSCTVFAPEAGLHSVSCVPRCSPAVCSPAVPLARAGQSSAGTGAPGVPGRVRAASGTPRWRGPAELVLLHCYHSSRRHTTAQSITSQPGDCCHPLYGCFTGTQRSWEHSSVTELPPHPLQHHLVLGRRFGGWESLRQMLWTENYHRK